MTEPVILRQCDTCRYCLIKDYGYSNYTTEGSNVYCLLDRHPERGFDKFYGEDKRLKFAEWCTSYSAGEPVQVDVDHQQCPDYHTAWEPYYSNDVRIVELLRRWSAVEAGEPSHTVADIMDDPKQQWLVRALLARDQERSDDEGT